MRSPGPRFVNVETAIAGFIALLLLGYLVYTLLQPEKF